MDVNQLIQYYARLKNLVDYQTNRGQPIHPQILDTIQTIENTAAELSPETLSDLNRSVAIERAQHADYIDRHDRQRAAAQTQVQVERGLARTTRDLTPDGVPMDLQDWHNARENGAFTSVKPQAGDKLYVDAIHAAAEKQGIDPETFTDNLDEVLELYNRGDVEDAARLMIEHGLTADDVDAWNDNALRYTAAMRSAQSIEGEPELEHHTVTESGERKMQIMDAITERGGSPFDDPIRHELLADEYRVGGDIARAWDAHDRAAEQQAIRDMMDYENDYEQHGGGYDGHE